MRITLKSYQQYNKQLLKAQEQDSTLSDLELLECFLEQDKDTISKLPLKFIEESLKDVSKLLSQDAFEFKPTIKHNGILYGFIPNLDKISYGENADLLRYISDWSTMHRAISVAYRPIKKNWLGRPKTSKGKYLIEDYAGTDNADDFLDLDIEIVLGMQVFFYNLTKELVNSIPSYLKSVEKDLEVQTSSLRNGGSIKSYIHSLKEISLSLKL